MGSLQPLFPAPLSLVLLRQVHDVHGFDEVSQFEAKDLGIEIQFRFKGPFDVLRPPKPVLLPFKWKILVRIVPFYWNG